MQVVTEKTPFAGGTVGINNFGFGGTNVHMLIRSNIAPRKSTGLLPQYKGINHVSFLPETFVLGRSWSVNRIFVNFETKRILLRVELKQSKWYHIFIT